MTKDRDASREEMRIAHEEVTYAQVKNASLRTKYDRQHAAALVVEKDSRDALLESKRFSWVLAVVDTDILSSLCPLGSLLG